ncbi:AbrB/MazE/SpoVT family DNA-binding domain-containing protein [Methylacidimicrobium cyclopophantes]|uniref:AbrB/MazE/SpoVT family DNA-binding domain-containing protein n=1 Tax=Methylacidimicrobium cyclopophantes TaxID=1041766 RepID=UPI0015B48C9E|nr:AbrB/MazE/SpoVT family DNA-binding domain-containing protein [Methylacidimicrobium cyclopophantes]
MKTVSEGNGRPVGTTRLSIKGQVVIPEAICKSLDLKRGDQFFVLADKDTICLRVLRPPTSREWAQLQELANLLMKGLSQPAAAA